MFLPTVTSQPCNPEKYPRKSFLGIFLQCDRHSTGRRCMDPDFGWTLNPMFGAAAMSLSSFCVVTNALRLNLFKIHDTKKDKKIKQATSIEVKNDYNKKEKEQKTMVKVTVNVEGMMCGHCEAHVNEAIKKAFGVEDVVSSHENNTTVFTAPEKVDETRSVRRSKMPDTK